MMGGEGSLKLWLIPTQPFVSITLMGKYTKTVGLSHAAFEGLTSMKSHLEDHPGWFHRTSHSTVIEFLIWHWRLTAPEGPGFVGFDPETRPGRPANYFQPDPMRPAKIRADMEKDPAARSIHDHERSSTSNRDTD